MFEGLGNKLTGLFDRLKGRGALTEADVDAALREMRIALLEADVALPVVKDFIASLREKAIGAEVLRSITPGQQMVKITHDALAGMLGGEAVPLRFTAPPSVIVMLGLQGSGKTTSAGKLALHLKEKERKKVLLASLDTRRPAAQEQLAILAGKVGAESLPIVAGEAPLAITKRAMEEARRGGFDVVILDTAGRLAIDAELMAEAKDVAELSGAAEKLLVADAMTGQDALAVAKSFHETVGVTGILLTRLDSDARGGAALSMRAATGQPIKFLGSGEKLEALEIYHPDRVASRILGQGDVLSLVEKAAAEIDAGEAKKAMESLQKGKFDFDDLAAQLRQMRKMGGLSGIASMLPGAGKLKAAMDKAEIDESIIKRQEAIIGSMTKKERGNPDLLNASRKKRIARGAGVEVAEINRLFKQYLQMRDMMRQMKKLGGKKALAQWAQQKGFQ